MLSSVQLDTIIQQGPCDEEDSEAHIDAAVTDEILVTIPWRASRVYKCVQDITGQLGGNGSGGAIYGEVTMYSMQRIINFLVKNCRFGAISRFIDIGSGRGKPNFHVAQDPGVRLSIGIELEEIRWQVKESILWF